MGQLDDYKRQYRRMKLELFNTPYSLDITHIPMIRKRCEFILTNDKNNQSMVLVVTSNYSSVENSITHLIRQLEQEYKELHKELEAIRQRRIKVYELKYNRDNYLKRKKNKYNTVTIDVKGITVNNSDFDIDATKYASPFDYYRTKYNQ